MKKDTKQVVKELEQKEVAKEVAPIKPTIALGNYVIEVVDKDNKVIKRVLVSNAAVNIVSLEGSGIAVDLN